MVTCFTTPRFLAPLLPGFKFTKVHIFLLPGLKFAKIHIFLLPVFRFAKVLIFLTVLDRTIPNCQHLSWSYRHLGLKYFLTTSGLSPDSQVLLQPFVMKMRIKPDFKLCVQF